MAEPLTTETERIIRDTFRQTDPTVTFGQPITSRIGTVRRLEGEKHRYLLKHVTVTDDVQRSTIRYEGLRREARVLDQLPWGGGTRLLASHFDETEAWSVQPWIGDTTVWDETDGLRREEVGEFGLDRLLDTLIDMASAVKDLHERGYLHGDLQPVHFVRDFDGRLQLIDFDVSVAIGGNDDYGGALVHYVAPEIAARMPERSRDLVPTERSEVYSFGAVAYFLLTGQTLTPYPEGAAFAEKCAAVAGGLQRGIPCSIEQKAPGIASLVQRAVRTDQSDRTPDMPAILETLQAMRGGGV
ncbi:protein kinase domain-containing protein [Haloglycomyces albus]|uniref:protein kinase domain-containing protein n=1 Tax=Haloglycomyces albus TaxID=526067 RepID=UPI00046D546D|nr:protein kinase [Haloglycomyces albus]